ncbi:uncharacterized protein LOC119610483 [Lucilia sericata]|uniref:uncharacterized protein LOC119610483 n=1 Tax=Lucilia sericata TaxID=13632 RepID=UPI0018A80884|nr:uncharacterized protein LOC119610483 [Lucilia sericata]
MSPGHFHDFENLTQNNIITKTIFQYLSLKDQLTLAQVTLQLKNLYRNFIWNVDYEKLVIIKCPQDFLVCNETNINMLALSLAELEEFINLYGSDIKELNLQYLSKYELCPSELKEIGVDIKEIYEKRHFVLSLEKIPNLISLSCNNMILTQADIQSIARYSTTLEKLSIYSCFNDKCDVFALGGDLKLKTLLDMKQLKYLCMGSSMLLTLSYEDFHELITKSKLKQLYLKYKIEKEKVNIYEDQWEVNALEELEIGTNLTDMKWGLYFQGFKNLKVLTLQDIGIINREFLIVLANTCEKLKTLSINYTTFENINNFQQLSSLKELNIQICQGLSHSNLRQILTEMNLQKFTSLWTKYEGKFEDFIISSKIQFLEIEILKTPDFKGAYEANENLRSLIWHDDYAIPRQVYAFNCPNLQQLEIESGFIPLEILLQLNSLHSLTLRNVPANFPWSYVIEILEKHLSLQEFTIKHLNYHHLDLKLTPTKAFKCVTNINCIKIPTRIFEVAIDFWFDLLYKNPKVQLICLDWFSKELLHDLINNPKFPGFLRFIYIQGFKVVCKDLRYNFANTLEKIHFNKHKRLSVNNNNYGVIFNGI